MIGGRANDARADEAIARPASPLAEDDSLLPFAVEPLDLRGRLVRLGPAVHSILTHYDYPPSVARLLGEAAALTALLGSLHRVAWALPIADAQRRAGRYDRRRFRRARKAARLRAL